MCSTERWVVKRLFEKWNGLQVLGISVGIRKLNAQNARVLKGANGISFGFEVCDHNPLGIFIGINATTVSTGAIQMDRAIRNIKVVHDVPSASFLDVGCGRWGIENKD